MAAVLLLYYHLVNGGGFTGDETVYIDPDVFDGYSYLEVEVIEGYEVDIDQTLLRQGAIVYLLCDLNDMVGEFEESFQSQDLTKKIISAYKQCELSEIPEIDDLLGLLEVGEEGFNFQEYQAILHKIFNLYVVGMFSELANKIKP
ncbi:hypothetical protein [Teredinibacter turnerae]|uniref:hypothetical protein n=1 Tax=Teredinibacter turnerae TaxID=2426 RepID=UPI0012BBAE9A|nr:hypothetical protein [Teredinibacter turnerae]